MPHLFLPLQDTQANKGLSCSPPGSVVRVHSGKMRNVFFPRGMAEYVSVAQLADLGLSKWQVTPRSLEYRPQREGAKAAALKEQRRALQQQREEQRAAEERGYWGRAQTAARLRDGIDAVSRRLLEDNLPKVLTFYAKPIADAEGVEQGEGDRTVAIFGSIAPANVAAKIAEELAGASDAEARMVSVTPDQIRIQGLEQEGAAADRVKHLGSWPATITLSPDSEPIDITLRVLPTLSGRTTSDEGH